MDRTVLKKMTAAAARFLSRVMEKLTLQSAPERAMWRAVAPKRVTAAAASILSRATDKLSLLLVREPAVFDGVAEQIEWIHRELRYWTSAYFCYFPEELVDIAYDVEDIIDQLSLKVAAAQGTRRGILQRLVLFISNLIHERRIHKKLQQVKVKISHFHTYALFLQSAGVHFELDLSISTHHQNMARTVASPVLEKTTALLAQEALYPEVKKRARRIHDEFTFLFGLLEKLESKELDDRGMVWMEELCLLSCSAVDVIGLFINRRERLGKTWIGLLRRVVLAFDSLTSQHKLCMEMDKIKARLLDISQRTPSEVTTLPQSRDSW